VPIQFLRRKTGGQNTAAGLSPVVPVPTSLPEEVIAQDHQLRLTYAGKTSEGVRMASGAEAMLELPTMIGSIAISPIEVVEPREMDTGTASPMIIRTEEASAWLRAHGALSPITRHALYVLETVDAVDPAYETVLVALLDGTTDPAGYPDYSAIVGGIAAHWDESTGELIVRSIVGWGGRGARGDTERTAGRLLARILRNVLDSGRALGMSEIDRPVIVHGSTAIVCPHCAFDGAPPRAVFCPKCGMRLVRS
jgi:hypothetical protein